MVTSPAARFEASPGRFVQTVCDTLTERLPEAMSCQVVYDGSYYNNDNHRVSPCVRLQWAAVSSGSTSLVTPAPAGGSVPASGSARDSRLR